MSESPEKPDIEKLVSEIRKNSEEAATSGGEPIQEAGPPHIHALLAEANEACLVRPPSGPNMQHSVLRMIYKPLGKLLAEINRFNASVVRVLNSYMNILEGKDRQVGSELLEAQQRRVELLERLSARLAAYDDAELEKRVRELEQRLDRIEGGSGS